jgi:multidrug efflux pump subunit AcrA (membrane-fusion protein)
MSQYECDCGERFVRVDMRDSEAVATLTAQLEQTEANMADAVGAEMDRAERAEVQLAEAMSQRDALREALQTARGAALGGMARQHLDRSGILNDPPHGWGKFAECEAPWCVRNQTKLAHWDALLASPVAPEEKK